DHARHGWRGASRRPSRKTTTISPATEDHTRADRVPFARAWPGAHHGRRRRRPVRHRDLLAGRRRVWLWAPLDGAYQSAVDVGDSIDVRAHRDRRAQRSRRRAPRALSALDALVRVLAARHW